MVEENKKYILYKTENGDFIKRRILAIYQFEDPNKDYAIFYDDSQDEIEKFGVVSYDTDTDFENICTKLTEKEIQSAQKIIEIIRESD